MVRDRRYSNNINEHASGISEELTAVDELLDNMIHEKNEAERKKKENKEEATEKEKKLNRYGEEVLTSATSHAKKKTTVEKEDRLSSRRRKREMIDQDDGWNELVTEKLKIKRENEDRVYSLREAELQLMKAKLDEDRKDREASRQQRKKQFELINAIYYQ